MYTYHLYKATITTTNNNDNITTNHTNDNDTSDTNT